MLSHGIVRNFLYIAFASLVVFSFFSPVFVEPLIADAATTEEEFREETERVEAETRSNDGFNFSCDGPGSCFLRVIIEANILVIQFSLLILSLAGILLDLSLLLTFNMGALLNPGTTLGKVVAETWTIFRDLTNLLLIAGMIWASITMILQISTPGGNTGRFIANIIIAAVLVNFSYFFTGAIIDASNTASRLIYQEGITNTTSGQTSVSLASVVSINEMVRMVTGDDQRGSLEGTPEGLYLSFIGAQFVDKTKLVSILDPVQLREFANQGTLNSPIILLLLLGTLVIGATIELFVSMFFVIIGRVIILLILLILSPLIVFRLMGIPPFATWGEQWWKSLMSQVVFLPVFVFLVAVSFRVIGGLAATIQTSEISLASIFTNPSGTQFEAAVGLILLYVIAWGLLKTSKTISQNIAQGKQVELPNVAQLQKFAADAGNWTGARAKGLTGAPRALTLGSAGWALNNLISRPLRIQEAFDERVADPWRSRPGWMGGDRFAVERKRHIKEQTRGRVDTARRDIEYWEDKRDAAEKSGDADAQHEANEKLAKASERLDNAYNNMHGTLGAGKMAQYLRDNPEQINAALDALDSEKAEEVVDELKRLGVSDIPSESEIEDKKKKKSGDDSGEGTEENLISQIKGLRADQRKAFYKEHAAQLRAAAADEASSRELVAAIKESGGSVGEALPASAIIGNTAVLKEITGDDLAVIADRDDISQEEYREIIRDLETIAERKDIVDKHESSPAAIARAATGEDSI